jgi:hypothetical protein
LGGGDQARPARIPNRICSIDVNRFTGELVLDYGMRIAPVHHREEIITMKTKTNIQAGVNPGPCRY